MDWGKVIMKSLKAFLGGGIAAVAAVQPSTVEEAQGTGLIALVFGFLGGVMNWWKHRDD